MSDPRSSVPDPGSSGSGPFSVDVPLDLSAPFDDVRLESLRRALLTVSHDLRSPLTGLSALVAMIQGGSDGPLTPAQERRLDRIRESCDRLGRILGAVGDLALLESGRARLQISTIDPGALAEGVCAELAPAARSRLIELRLRSDPELPRLHGDAGWIRRLLHLLITSALATVEGPVLELSLSAAPGGIEGTLREIRSPRPLEAVAADGAPRPAEMPDVPASPLPHSAALAALLADAILRAHGGAAIASPATGSSGSAALAAFFLPCRPAAPESNA